jgi:hypothetical protein
VDYDHPVRLTSEDDLVRSRLTVFFRLLLAIPHFIWIALWSLAVVFVAIFNWFATLFQGRSPSWCHRFLSAYIRYSAHLAAYVSLTANPYPEFVGQPGSYLIDVQLPPEPELQNRWKTGFRLILAFPALVVNSALNSAVGLVAFLAWFVGLIKGEMPEGLRNLGVFALRYNAQTYGYMALLTDRYPFSGPSLEVPRADPTSPAPA